MKKLIITLFILTVSCQTSEIYNIQLTRVFTEVTKFYHSHRAGTSDRNDYFIDHMTNEFKLKLWKTTENSEIKDIVPVLIMEARHRHRIALSICFFVSGISSNSPSWHVLSASMRQRRGSGSMRKQKRNRQELVPGLVPWAVESVMDLNSTKIGL